MKHFVSANLGPNAGTTRQVYGLEMAPQKGRGVSDDKYISRHENLGDVLSALGEASGLGYDITPDLNGIEPSTSRMRTSQALPFVLSFRHFFRFLITFILPLALS